MVRSGCLLSMIVSIGLILSLASRASANCGDGVTTTGEACDAGTPICQGGTNAGSECTRATDCNSRMCACSGVSGTGSCIDGIGNRDDVPNACRSSCMLPSCGDGVSDNGEQCDDGANNGDSKRCLGNAPHTACAIGAVLFTNPGIPGATVKCANDADCFLLSGGAAKCRGNPQCRLNVCGDGRVCSDLNCISGNASVLSITPGFPAPEACDDGNTINTDSCTSFNFSAQLGANSVPQACRLPLCGDGVTNGTEQCDAGLATCLSGPRIGKVCTTNADCTLGNIAGTCSPNGNRNDVADSCRSNCGVAICGDGISDVGEGCDDGNTSDIPPDYCNEVHRCQGGENPGALCTSNSNCTKGTCGPLVCEQNKCGDGTTNGHEECDDGNTVAADPMHPGDTCGVSPAAAAANPKPPGCNPALLENLPNACIVAACRNPFCGDGVTQAGEQCDAGQAVCNAASGNHGAPCTKDTDCFGGASAACGPGNRDDVPNACRSSCKAPFCGDGVVDNGEQCDNGANNGDSKPCIESLVDPVSGLTTHCVLNLCGDGKVCSDSTCTSGPICNALGVCTPGPGGPEQCDDGNTVSLDGCTNCIASTCGDGLTGPNEQCDSRSLGCSNRAEDLSTPEVALTCCFDGQVAAASSIAASPGFISVEQAFVALLGCRLPNLVAAAACDKRLQRSLQRIQNRVVAAQVFSATDGSRARRIMHVVERRLGNLNRAVARSTKPGGKCAAFAASIANQKADAAALVGGIEGNI